MQMTHLQWIAVMSQKGTTVVCSKSPVKRINDVIDMLTVGSVKHTHISNIKPEASYVKNQQINSMWHHRAQHAMFRKYALQHTQGSSISEVYIITASVYVNNAKAVVIVRMWRRHLHYTTVTQCCMVLHHLTSKSCSLLRISYFALRWRRKNMDVSPLVLAKLHCCLGTAHNDFKIDFMVFKVLITQQQLIYLYDLLQPHCSTWALQVTVCQILHACKMGLCCAALHILLQVGMLFLKLSLTVTFCTHF